MARVAVVTIPADALLPLRYCARCRRLIYADPYTWERGHEPWCKR